MGKPNIQNLIPIKKGQVLNPNGRKGKGGPTTGLSLINKFKWHLEHIDKASPKDIEMIWNSLVNKAKEGDIKAIELMVKLNGERLEYDNNQNNQPTNLIINMPTLNDSSES